MIHEIPRGILIHGVFSTRKTSQAVTASKDYPRDKVPPFNPVASITDCAIVAWDDQPTLTFPALGIDLAPERIFKTTGRMQQVPGKEDFEAEPIVNTINASRRWAVEQAKKGVKFFIHDTVSTKDTSIVGYWSRLIDDDPKQGSDSAVKLYRNVLKTHSMELQWWQNMAAHFDAYNIWLCHSDVKGQDAPSKSAESTAATAIQRSAKGLTGAELGARITGKSWNYFYEVNRMVFYQTIETEYGKSKAVWITRSTDYAVKPGLPDFVLPDKVSANFQELFARARGEKKGP